MIPMTDQEIIQKLIERDNRVTKEFFFTYCRPVFLSVIRKVFDYEVDYNEFVSELYAHLMENDARRLKTFQFTSSLFQWIKVVAIYYFIKKRNRLIENQSKEPPYEERNDDMTFETTMESKIDAERILAEMTSERYAFVLRKLILEDMTPDELASIMDTNTANIYNIKKRAILQLTQIVIKDIKNYEKQ